MPIDIIFGILTTLHKQIERINENPSNYYGKFLCTHANTMFIIKTIGKLALRMPIYVSMSMQWLYRENFKFNFLLSTRRAIRSNEYQNHSTLLIYRIVCC